MSPQNSGKSPGMLSGLRVLDLSRLLPGGLCTLMLADLGAEVIKIEAPPHGDYARARGPFHDDVEPTTASASFRGLNRNKLSVVLDLKTDVGRDALLALVRESDVMIESYRPGVLERLRLDYTALSSANPGIILCRISGWGQTGPMAQAAGHDINYLAAMGLLSPTGFPDDPPALSFMQVADSAAGLFASNSILAALHERVSSGSGQQIDVSLAHSALSFASMSVAATLAGHPASPAHASTWGGGAVCYNAYRSKDGWVVLGALELKFWTAWCNGIGRPDLIGHRYDAPGTEAHAAVTAIMAARGNEEWRAFAAEHDCCLTVVDGLERALSSDLVRGRGTVRELEHTHGEPYTALTHPVLFSHTPADPYRNPAPALGADTERLTNRLLPRGLRSDRC